MNRSKILEHDYSTMNRNLSQNIISHTYHLQYTTKKADTTLSYEWDCDV